MHLRLFRGFLAVTTVRIGVQPVVDVIYDGSQAGVVDAFAVVPAHRVVAVSHHSINRGKVAGFIRDCSESVTKGIESASCYVELVRRLCAVL